MLKLENPRRGLPAKAPFVLASDAPAIDQFHQGPVDESQRLHLELIPEPFLGRPDAPVVLLNLNPGFSERDILSHEDPVFAAAAMATLHQEVQSHPFYLLDPRFKHASDAE